MANHTRVKTKADVYPLIGIKERLALLRQIKGMWKHRGAEVKRGLQKIKQDRERFLPHR